MAAVRYLVFASLCFVAALAHALTGQVSETFPLTDTIYGPSAGEGKLRSDGEHAFLFWVDEDRLNVTRIDGDGRVAKLVFPFFVGDDGDFDAVWTGSHFLVVAQSPAYELIGLRVNSSGDPLGEPFRMAENALWPRLAFNGRHVLLLYDGDGVMTQLLTTAGTPAGEPAVLDQTLLSSSELHMVSNGDGFAAIVPEAAFTPQSLFVLDAEGGKVTQQTLDAGRGSWTLASNGSRYLAVAAHLGQSVAYVFEGNGTPAARVDFQHTAGVQRFYRFPSAVWTGSRWLLAVHVENGTFTRLLEIDADGQLDVLSDLAGTSGMQLVNAGGRVVGAWREQASGMVSGDVPLTGSARPVLFAARPQRFLTTAASSSGTLFVWQDLEPGRSTLRAGLRTHDGRWTEREIAGQAAYAMAASDGAGFVVVTRWGANGDRIIRLDANGDPIPGGTEPFDAFMPLAIASNGNGYALLGMRTTDSVPNGNLLAVHITGTGVSEVRELPFQAARTVDVDLASDGEGYLAAWGVEGPCSPVVVFCAAERIDSLLLTGSAIPNGPVLPLTEAETLYELELGWNGRDYVLVRNAGGVTASHVSRSGSVRDRHTVSTEHGSSLSLVPGNGAVVVGWVSDQGVFAATVTDTGADAQPLKIDDDPRNFPWYDGTLADVGNGALAFVFSAKPEAAPIHGRQHVMAKYIAPALPARPPAPLLTVRRDGANAILQWTANGAVDGFRVEQRIGDGPWIEVGGWIDGSVRSLTVPAGLSTQFRVRGFNEAGAGAYSSSPRRRAVR